MSDRIAGLSVTLQDDMRDDDAQSIIDAIAMIRGVVTVQAHVADIEHHFAKEQARREMTDQLRDVLIKGRL